MEIQNMPSADAQSPQIKAPPVAPDPNKPQGNHPKVQDDDQDVQQQNTIQDTNQQQQTVPTAGVRTALANLGTVFAQNQGIEPQSSQQPRGLVINEAGTLS